MSDYTGCYITIDFHDKIIVRSDLNHLLERLPDMSDYESEDGFVKKVYLSRDDSSWTHREVYDLFTIKDLHVDISIESHYEYYETEDRTFGEPKPSKASILGEKLRKNFVV